LAKFHGELLYRSGRSNELRSLSHVSGVKDFALPAKKAGLVLDERGRYEASQ